MQEKWNKNFKFSDEKKNGFTPHPNFTFFRSMKRLQKKKNEIKARYENGNGFQWRKCIKGISFGWAKYEGKKPCERKNETNFDWRQEKQKQQLNVKIGLILFYLMFICIDCACEMWSVMLRGLYFQGFHSKRSAINIINSSQCIFDREILKTVESESEYFFYEISPNIKCKL